MKVLDFNDASECQSTGTVLGIVILKMVNKFVFVIR